MRVRGPAAERLRKQQGLKGLGVALGSVERRTR